MVLYRSIFLSVPNASATSPFRLRVPRGRNDISPPPKRPKGSRRPHTDAMVARVRRLIQQTTLTYGEISARTNVACASISRWTRDQGWTRPLFAPRATDTVSRERASAQLKLRTLAARLAALAERYVRELEESEGVDVDKLAEAYALYRMTKVALRPRKREPKALRPTALTDLGDAPVPKLLTELAEGGVDLYAAPREAVKDYIESRKYADLKQRPRRLSKRQRQRRSHHAWLMSKV